MAVRRINGIIKKLDWNAVNTILLSVGRDDADPGFEVCDATFEDWERYVKSENQALVSRAMAFENGKIYIVELPSGVHDAFCRSLDFGPDPGIGAIRPGGMTWLEYHTLKVEVGVSRGWPHLDQKADQWRQFPGVEYILCIRLSPALRVLQYKLFTVDNRANPLPHMDPVPIVNPTNVVFDSRRLLGLPAQVDIPQGFTQPNLEIDLFPIVERLMRRNH